MENQYSIKTQNENERLAIIKTFVALGCQIHGGNDYTPESFVAEFSHWRYPVVVVEVGRKYLAGDVHPRSGKTVTIKDIGEVIAALTPPPAPEPVKIVFPAPALYEILYKTLDNEVKTYRVSNPISMDENKFTSYAMGKGPRSFILKRVLSFKKIS